MTSNTVTIHSTGEGFRDASLETERMAAGLPEAQATQLCLITEEMLSLFNSITGSVSNAEFRIENENNLFTFTLSVRQKLGNTQRSELIQSSTSGSNEAYKGFLGMLKEIIVQTMSVGRDIDMYVGGDTSAADPTDAVMSAPKWDKFERSVLLAITDNVKVSIKGGVVNLIAFKQL